MPNSDHPTWQSVSAAKIAAREALIPAEWRISVPESVVNVTAIPASCGLLSAAEVAITETSATRLIAAMVEGKLTSEAVTTAFCKRAAVAHQLTNCLTEIMFTQGIAAAKAIDAEFKRTGKPAGALHGLPVSLKDNINIPGFDSTVGFISFANKPADEPADIVATLLAAGAVLFCKTNVPTGMVR
jgi:amidase